jgi:signal transduction histidine kinase
MQNKTLYNALEQTKTPGILVNKNNKITRVTDATCELFEIERFELVGKDASYLFEKSQKQELSETIRNIQQNDVKIIDNLTINTKTGQCHVLCKISNIESVFKYHSKMIIFHDRTNIINYIKQIEDSEKQLKAYSKLFKSTFDDSFLPSVIIQEDGIIKNYNKSFFSLIKKQAIKLNSDSIFNILHIDKHSFKEEITKNNSFEISVLVNNKTHNFVFNLHNIKNNDEELILCQIQDITRQKRSENLRRELEKQIKQTRKVEYLGELAGIISHEFNNALMPIISFTTSVEKSLPSKYATEKEKLNKVIQASNHAKNMIAQIMDIKHIDFHTKQEVNLKDIIHNIIDGDKYSFKNISFPINITAENTKTLGNNEVFEKAITNIIDNSIQAIGNKEGKVNITIEDVCYEEKTPKTFNNHKINKNQTYLKLEISDNGIGIKEQDLESIFNPFFTTKHFNKQIGTGLTYVYNCLDRYSIPFTVISNNDKGVSITLFLTKL